MKKRTRLQRIRSEIGHTAGPLYDDIHLLVRLADAVVRWKRNVEIDGTSTGSFALARAVDRLLEKVDG